MKNKTLARVLALALAALMCVGLVACTGNTSGSTTTATTAATAATTAAATTAATTTTTAATTAATTTTTAAPKVDVPLVVAYSPFSQKFSPYVADTGYDQDVVTMTQISLMTTDRSGGIVYNAIAGEEREYNGTMYTYTGAADLKVEYDEKSDITTYTATLRKDLVFSDGEPVTADDVIFNYYVYLDPSYVGSTTLNSYPIIGLINYQYNNSLAEGVEISAEEISALLEKPDEAFGKQLTDFVSGVLVSELDWVKTLYGNESYKKYTDAYPVAKDLFYAFYGTDADYDSTKVEKEEDVLAKVLEEYGMDWKLLGVGYGGAEDYYEADMQAMAEQYLFDNAIGKLEGEEVPNIEGIKKIDEYTVQVQTKGYSAPAVYSILGIQVAPMHYYGDASLYDYDNNQFGFTRGDLSAVLAKTTSPVGAGPYKFVEYTDKVVYFEANEDYYKGAPKTKYVQFLETASADVLPGIVQGTADAGETNGTKTNFEAIRGYNTNGELEGDVITISSVDNLGYGYIGMNADTMNVGGEPASDASKNLRRAFATVLAAYRDVSIDSYYGDAATVIQYPISNTSWAAPQKSDADYQMAFSVDIDGNPIYTDDMDADAKYAAALDAAIGFLKAAGYTFDEATGKFTAAPDGALLSYEAIIPADGAGDHPSFMILSNAKAALETIGIELVINDPADSNELWDKLDAGTQNIWCAAWGATIDPDMYQVYHSSGIVGQGGSDSNHYHINDAELDKLIVEARESDDQSYRKTVYKACLDIIIDWAVEIPNYQRQNIVAFSPERVNMDTVTPDITTYWGWMSEIQLIEMN
ncbi:MAG: ABC transporter substrate-binding protein [Clostridiaceae bacterium]|nr:ABC transporter substrate-binding protein [Clostridiaceae bacterium]